MIETVMIQGLKYFKIPTTHIRGAERVEGGTVWGRAPSFPTRDRVWGGGCPHKSLEFYIWNGVSCCFLSGIFVSWCLWDVTTVTPGLLAKRAGRLTKW